VLPIGGFGSRAFPRSVEVRKGDSSTIMNVENRMRSRTSALRRDGLLRWLAKLAAKRWVSLALIVGILIVDLVIPWAGWSYLPRWQGLSFVPRAFVDEPCAVATALIVLGAITRFRAAPPDPKFGWSLLGWSVLIDIDHLPQEFGTSVITEGTPRPYLHALWVLVLLIFAILMARYWSQHAKAPIAVGTMQVLAGAAWGIAAHFLRDVATAPMSLWWPVTKTAVQEPYWSYVVALLVIVALPPVRRHARALHAQRSKPAVTLPDDRT
jgi:inner membrane protein